MGDFRRHKKDSYTCIDNHVFKDHTLSMKAKGLLTQIYSLPDDWEYSVTGLAKLFSDGKEAVNNALQELIKHGYIVRTQRTDETGRFAGYEYDIYETPQTNVEENPSTGEPFTENPSTDKPSTDNQAQLNTNIETTNKENTNEDITPIIPAEIAKRKEMFEQFWEAYPKCKRKVDKKGCERKFIKIENLEQIFPDIMASLEMWKRSRQWTKNNGEYIPLTSKWINQEYWTVTDDRTETQTKFDEAADEHFRDFFIGG